MLAIDGEFFSCSVDAGFILALRLHRGDLELVSVEVSTMKIMLAKRGIYAGHYGMLHEPASLYGVTNRHHLNTKSVGLTHAHFYMVLNFPQSAGQYCQP